jgi:hypothetical protein
VPGAILPDVIVRVSRRSRLTIGASRSRYCIRYSHVAVHQNCDFRQVWNRQVFALIFCSKPQFVSKDSYFAAARNFRKVGSEQTAFEGRVAMQVSNALCIFETSEGCFVLLLVH